MRAARDGRPPIPAAIVSPGDVLRYKDVHDVVQTVRIKDLGSSAMKGEYFILTDIINEEDDDDSHDQEVPNDVVEDWVNHRIDR
jgi:hypothetical protein